MGGSEENEKVLCTSGIVVTLEMIY